jgi:hypothetical protein
MAVDFKRFGGKLRCKSLPAYSAALLEHYKEALAAATTKKEVSAIGLGLFSDVFSFCHPESIRQDASTTDHEPDVKPFADYVARNFFASFDPLDLDRCPTNKERLTFGDRIRSTLYNLFPSSTFRIVGTASSIPVAHLSLTSCVLVFLLFISYMVPLGGVPMTLELFFLLFGSLCVLAFFFQSTAIEHIASAGASSCGLR